MAKKTPELLSYVKELNEEWLKSEAIADKIKEELWILVTSQTIRNWLKSEIDKWLDAVKEFNKEIEYTNPFEFEWEDIVFYVKSREWEWVDRIALPINIIEYIWTDYTSHWNNLTWQQVMEKYELNPRAWQTLKSRLWLYKSSNILPDWLLEKIENEKGEEAVEEKINEVSYKAAISKYKSKIAKRYRQNKEKEYEKAITKLYQIEDYLSMLREYIDNYQPEKFIDVDNITNLHKQNSGKEVYNNGTLYTTITDLHIGKEWTDEIINRLRLFTKEIINRPEKNVKLFILWDLVESVIIGWKHPNVVEKMDWPYWFDLLMKSVSLLENIITEIYKSGKTIEIHWLFWNHDHFDKQDNLDWTAGLVIYEMIKRWINSLWIKLNYYRDVWNTINTDDFCFIINHWTWPQTRKKPQDILWEFGDNKKENIILQWDKHHAEMNNVSKNWTKLLIPAIAGTGAYDKQLWISSMTWFTIIKKWYNWKPKVEFIFLN